MASYRKVAGGYKAEVCVNGNRKARTFDTKAEARSWATQTEFELGKMGIGVSTTATLNDVFQRYSIEVSETKKGGRWEIVRLKKFSKFALARMRLIDIRREHLEAFIDEQLNKISPASINRELNLISNCFTHARRWRLMDHNPMADLKRPKDPPPRDRRIADDEIEKILLVLGYQKGRKIISQQQRVAVAFLFALETAMRAGEICSLIPKHIDLVKRTALLPNTKNGSSRKVPLSSEALGLLNLLVPWTSDSVFGLSSSSLSTQFAKAVKKTDIEDLTFHDSRHEAVTRLAEKLDVMELARCTGHKDLKQLMTYYNKSAEDLAKLLD